MSFLLLLLLSLTFFNAFLFVFAFSFSLVLVYCMLSLLPCCNHSHFCLLCSSFFNFLNCNLFPHFITSLHLFMSLLLLPCSSHLYFRLLVSLFLSVYAIPCFLTSLSCNSECMSSLPTHPLFMALVPSLSCLPFLKPLTCQAYTSNLHPSPPLPLL